MKSPTLFTSGDDEELEEGEIVSDDFEDISDESIVFTPHGKSRTPKDPLPALSLSSVSDTEEQDSKTKRKRRKSSSKRRNSHKKQKRTVPPSLDNSEYSDSDSVVLDPELQLKLKAAVHVGPQEAHKNSLRSRLKEIMKETSGPDSDGQANGTSENVPQSVDGTGDDILNDISLVTGSGSEFESEGLGGDIVETDDNSGMEELDSELIQLRLEALKTAVQNKYANKLKKKKENQSSDDINKENNSANIETAGGEKINGDKVEIPVANTNSTDNTPISPEEDEDILRALLLASMSKKITKVPNNNLVIAPKGQNNIIPSKPKQRPLSNTALTKVNNFKVNNNFKSTLFKTVAIKPVKPPIKPIVTPQVKPLIICVNDSDSEPEFNSSPEKSPTKKPNNDLQSLSTKAIAPVEKQIESSVEKFLKEQRARVEAEVKPVSVKPVQTSSAPPKKIEMRPSSNNKKPSNLSKLTENSSGQKNIEKSALKFLPPNKREEYKRLLNLLKQKKAQRRKTKIRKNSVKVSGSSDTVPVISDIQSNKCSVGNSSSTNSAKTSINFLEKSVEGLKSVIPSNTPNVSKAFTSRATQTVDSCKLLTSKLESRINEFRMQEKNDALREQERKEQSTILRSILKQLQSRTNGRLQIEERYKSLRPLVKTLNQVTKEQKQCSQEVERLLKELSEARTRQQKLHDDMLRSVKELTEGKKRIDSSSSEVVSPLLLNPLITSTPLKSPTQIDTITVNDNSSPSTLILDITTIKLDEAAQHTTATKVGCSLDLGLSVTDPNDIDTIIKDSERRAAELEKSKKSGIVNYISPLMDCSRRKDGFDPFGIVCPFEVHGKCKDPDCGYNHLPK